MVKSFQGRILLSPTLSTPSNLRNREVKRPTEHLWLGNRRQQRDMYLLSVFTVPFSKGKERVSPETPPGGHRSALLALLLCKAKEGVSRDTPPGGQSILNSHSA